MDRLATSQPTPQEPYRLMAYFPIFTVFGAGILLGLNWKKLGKPEWQMGTIILSIVLPLFMIAFTVGWLMLLIPRSELPEQLITSVPMLALGINIGYLFGLAWLQNGAYKLFKKEGWNALPNYKYDTDGALFYGGLIALGTTLLGVFVFPLLG